MDTEWEVGQVLLDLYKVTGVLGEGGMGKVYKVHHLGWDIDLAVKSLKPQHFVNRKAIRAFLQECEAWVELGLHPFIVTCHYVRDLGGLPRIFAEYVDGGSLRQWIRDGRLYEGGHQKSLARILVIADQVLWGLHHAHQNHLIHRDVKPGNVLLTTSGIAKVTDFGLAGARLELIEAVQGAQNSEAVVQDRLASAGGMTPAYCSPEQAKRKKVSQKTDVWSWALCVLEMLAGGMVWKHGTEAPDIIQRVAKEGPKREHAPGVSPALRDLLLWCCRVDAADRPSNVLEIVKGVRSIYASTMGTPFPNAPPKSLKGRAEDLNNRAVSYIDLRKHTEAETAWRHALEICPKHTESTYNLGLLLWRTGNITDEDLVTQVEDAISMQTGSSASHRLLAHIHLERRDCEETLKLFNAIPEKSTLQGHDLSLLMHAKGMLSQSARMLRKIEAHADSGICVSLSRNGLYALTGSEDNSAKLWEITTGRCVRTFTGHLGTVTATALSHDGRIALTASADKTLRLYNVPDAQCIAVLQTNDSPTLCVSASYQFDVAVSGCREGKLMFWRLDDSLAKYSVPAHPGGVSDVAMTQDGTYVFSSGFDGLIHLWGTTDREILHTFQGHQGPVRALAVSPQGRLLVSAGDDGLLRVWNTETREPVRILRGHVGIIRDVSISKDGQWAVSAGEDGDIRLWDVNHGRCFRTFRGHTGNVFSVALSRRADSIVSTGKDHSVRVWCTGNQMPPYTAPYVLCHALRAEIALSTQLAFDKTLDRARKFLAKLDIIHAKSEIESARAISGFRRNIAAVDLWAQLYVHLPKVHLAGSWEIWMVEAHTAAVRSLDLSMDGRYLLTAGDDRIVHLWDMSQKKIIRSFRGHEDAVCAVQFDPSGRFAISISRDGAARCWDLSRNEPIKVFEPQGGTVEALDISPDGRFLAIGGWKTSLWDLRTGSYVRSFTGHSGSVFDLSWLPDSNKLLAATSEGQVVRWDIASEVCHVLFAQHNGPVRRFAVSANGAIAVSCSNPIWGRSSEVFCWSVHTGEQIAQCEGHQSIVNTVAISLDGRYILSGSTDGVVRLFDASTGKCLDVLSDKLHDVQSVCFSSDGRNAWAVDAAGKAYCWMLDWELEPRNFSDYDPRIDLYIDNFLSRHRPLPDDLSQLDGDPIRMRKALTRKGQAVYTESDVSHLIYQLRCAGLGWIRPDSVYILLEERNNKGFLDKLLRRRNRF